MAFNADPKDPKAGTQEPPTGGNGGQPDPKPAAGQPEDFEAKFYGAQGALKQAQERHKQEKIQLETRIQALEAEVEELQSLKTKADSADQLQKDLDAEKSAKAALESTKSKQDVLLKYPALLVPGKDGKPNPLLDVLMASNLDQPTFETKVADLAALDWAQSAGQNLRTGATPPPPPPQGGSDTKESWQQKAMDAHSRWIASGRKDKQAKSEEDAAWAEFNRIK